MASAAENARIYVERGNDTLAALWGCRASGMTWEQARERVMASDGSDLMALAAPAV